MPTPKDGLRVIAEVPPAFSEILTPEALRFIAKLVREFEARRQTLLQSRRQRQEELDHGVFPDFLKQTRDLREEDWTVAAFPKDLQDRRVEITGPVDRKMVINALNSGAKIFMADFEDSHSPTWGATIEGQINLRDVIRRKIEYVSPDGKKYALKDKTAVLMVRPRGWHLTERHLLIDDVPVSASLFDFGLFFFHNVQELLKRGTAPYFYLPKMESHLEARLWNDVFVAAQKEIGIPRGTIKATVLIETILAAFEMDEILYELRDHSAGLNCGRWDYIFSVIKKFASHKRFLLPDRAQVTMTTHFLHSYSRLLIKTCHRRGAFAMGGMAAQIPIKNDPVANKKALDKVIADKEREAGDGHDGTWVAHPALVATAQEVFDRLMPEPNQIKKQFPDWSFTAQDLLRMPQGTVTEAGVRTNLNVGVQYLASWLSGKGCVPLYNLMEDAATAEISRAQIWQWIRHQAVLEDGRTVTLPFVRGAMKEEVKKIRLGTADGASAEKLDLAVKLFDDMFSAKEFVEFLTVPAYQNL